MFARDDFIKTSQGTPSFQPPEVATGVERFSGEKLDIWSCGVTLFNFVTGDYPFQGDTIFKLFENIANGEYSFPCRVDRLLEDLVSQLLALEPDDRPNVRQALLHDWCRKRYPKTGQAATAPP
jgi:serine/threonine-protein kinase 11